MGKYSSYLFLAALYAVFFYCNAHMPMFTDDYWYTTIFGAGEAVTSLKDVFASQWNHYFTHGGRNVAHIFVQSFLYFGKAYFNAANALVFVGLVFLIHCFGASAKTRRQWDVWPFIYIFFCLWACVKNFGQTVFWLTGACNYLWMTTLILLFLLPYRLAFAGRVVGTGYLSAALMLLGGILAGWTNENTGFTAIWIAAAFVWFMHRRNDLKTWMIAGVIGACIGYGIMIAAPGNYIRKEIIFANVTLYEQLHEATKMFVTRLLVKQLPIWLGLAAILYACKSHQLWRRYNAETQCILLFVAASVFNNLVMFASPSFPGRAGFASTIFLTIAFIQGLSLCDKAAVNIVPPLFKRAARLGIGIYLILTVAITLQEYHVLYQEDQARIASLSEQKAQGLADIRLKPYSISGQGRFTHVYIADIYYKPDQEHIWANEIFAQYYGVKTAQLCCEPQHTR